MTVKPVSPFTQSPPFTLTEVLPTLCPTVLTDLVSVTAFLQSVQVSLASSAGAAATVTVQDKQSPPVIAMSIQLQPGYVQVIAFNGRTMAGGISILCDTANAVALTARWYQ